MIHRICAIDPGLKGAIAFADVSAEGFSEISVYDMPVSDDVDGRPLPDAFRLIDILHEEFPAMAILEHVGPRPKSGSASEWRFAMGFAATLTAMRVHFNVSTDAPGVHLVPPKTWKDALGLSSDKEQSLEMARKLFPSMSDALKRKSDDGRAEALLMLEYHRRVLMPRGDAGIEVC